MCENKPSSVERKVVATEHWSATMIDAYDDVVLQAFERDRYDDGSCSSVRVVGKPRPMVYVAGQWYLRDQIVREH